MTENRTDNIVVEYEGINYQAIIHSDIDGTWFEIPTLEDASGQCADGQKLEEGIVELIKCMVGDDFIPEDVDPELIG